MGSLYVYAIDGVFYCFANLTTSSGEAVIEFSSSNFALLKNGKTPEKQTILGVLEDIAEHTGEDRWRLKIHGQGELFS